MNITSAKYGIDQNGNNIGVMAVIDGETMWVPNDSGNRHWEAIIEWEKKDGNTIQDAD